MSDPMQLAQDFLAALAANDPVRYETISTLLRRRLEGAHARGYHLAAINAEPMSRPIVERYGFNEYARNYIYGWMPIIDLEVIKSLVLQ